MASNPSAIRSTPEQAVSESMLLAEAVRHSIDSIVITTPDPEDPLLVYVNPAFVRMTGYSAEESLGKNPRFLQGPRTDRSVIHRLKEDLRAGRVFNGEAINYRKDGGEFFIQWHIEPIYSSNGSRISHFLSVQRDVTERRAMEAQLIQAQKMELMWLMAGGVAHDYNNILNAVMGFAQLGKMAVPSGANGRDEFNQIDYAASKGMKLTEHLLNLSRQRFSAFSLVQVNDLIAGLNLMLTRILHKNIRIEVDLDPSLPAIHADSAQIEQLVLNAAINARDAMPHGGTLSFITRTVVLEESRQAWDMAVASGPCISLSIRDTGIGMSTEVQKHLFEPFYTTKAPGKGTGLGLSIIRTVLKQHNGCVMLKSDSGSGTTMEFLLPLTRGNAS